MFSFSISKINGILNFKNFLEPEHRNTSAFWCIQKADEIYNWNDFDEFIIHTHDYGDGNHYTFSKHDGYNNLVPCFLFHAWPAAKINDYSLLTKEIDNNGRNTHEINKVGWIGATTTHPNRKTLLEIGDNNKEIFDIIDMTWIRFGNNINDSINYISIPDLVKKYSVLIDIEGAGYSARLKTLLWSHRPLLIVDRPYKEYFFEFLEEWVHYIPVKRDMSDLVKKTNWCLSNYDKALRIAENAYQFSKKYLTREACYEKWNEIIVSRSV